MGSRQEVNKTGREGQFIGYHESHALPIRNGDTVLIKKGTKIRNLHYGESIAKRNYKIVVKHVLPGVTEQHYQAGGGQLFVHMKNPSVEWAGKGSYWTSADINDVEKV